MSSRFTLTTTLWSAHRNPVRRKFPLANELTDPGLLAGSNYKLCVCTRTFDKSWSSVVSAKAGTGNALPTQA
jgi:hypothetical protein